MTGVQTCALPIYIDGFAPTCKANDDLSRALGDSSEGQLAAALTYRATQTCAPVTAVAASGSLGKRNISDAVNANEPAIREFARPADGEKLLLPDGLSRASPLQITPRMPLDLGHVSDAATSIQ